MKSSQVQLVFCRFLGFIWSALYVSLIALFYILLAARLPIVEVLFGGIAIYGVSIASISA